VAEADGDCAVAGFADQRGVLCGCDDVAADAARRPFAPVASVHFAGGVELEEVEQHLADRQLAGGRPTRSGHRSAAAAWSARRLLEAAGS